MDREKIRKRLEVTERRVGDFEQYIIDARQEKSDMDPRLYQAMIAGLESVRDELKTEAEKYKTELRSD